MKILLTDFYGSESSDSANRIGDGLGPLQPADGRENALDINSMQFDAQKYVSEKLRTKSFAEILKLDNELTQETAALDSDMQLLVYDNYGKLVNATDTIRSMKSEIDLIESRLKKLSQTVEETSLKAMSVFSRMEPRRLEIGKLTRLHKLVQKLNFLFELPFKLESYIEHEKPRLAVSYFHRAIPILMQKTGIESFNSITSESFKIMNSLNSELIRRVLEDKIGFQKIKEYVYLLICLQQLGIGDPKDSEILRMRFLEWLEDYFHDKLTDLSSSQLSYSIQNFIDAVFDEVLSPAIEAFSFYKKCFKDSESSEPTPVSATQSSVSEEPTTEQRLTTISHVRKTITENVLNVLQVRLLGVSNSTVSSLLTGKESDSLFEALGVFIRRLNSVQTGEKETDEILYDRAMEIAEYVTRRQVIQVFDRLMNKAIFLLCDLAEQSNLSEQLPSNPETLAIGFMESLRTCISGTIEELNAIVDNSNKILLDMTAVLDNLVQFQLRSWFLWLLSAIECFCDTYHGSRRPGISILSYKKNENLERSSLLVSVPVNKEVLESPGTTFVLICVSFLLREYITSVDFLVASKEDIIHELDVTKGRVMLRFIEEYANRLCSELRPKLNEDSTVNASGQPLRIRDFTVWIIKNMDDLHEYVTSALSSLGNEVSEIAEGNEESPARVGGITDHRWHKRKLDYFRGKRNVHNGVERFFVQNIKIPDAVSFSNESIVSAVLRILLKGISEIIRELTLSQQMFQQLEADLHFIGVEMASILKSTAEINDTLHIIRRIAKERTVDPKILSPETILALCRAKHDEIISL